ncbi:hypothetical protein [Rhodococcus kronopolitis]|uniref:Histidine phosphatase family protein n=1 Tax=Rhodococcus kronopolitis TaxID=1460226 RepID=A0ABV9FUS3_9NOCA
MAKDQSDPTTIMLVRHAERPDEDGGSDPGVDADGTRCTESLTATGWRRAAALADLLAPADGEPDPPLVRPRALFASTPSRKNGSKRSLQTVTPLATRLAVEVNTLFGRADVKDLAKEVRRAQGPVLISWQREYLPDIVAALGLADRAVPDPWPEHRYDVVWVLTPTPDGEWNFGQAPQRLLPGDAGTGI